MHQTLLVKELDTILKVILI